LAEEKILYEIGQDEFTKSIMVADRRYQSKPTKKKVSTTLQKI
jgi:hypothetical protein